MDRLSPDRIDTLLDLAAGVRVVVAGDLMLDRYVSGEVERVSPEAPVPVVRVASETSAVGGAANVAANVRALGASCEVVGVVGRDAEGDQIRASLEALGVGTDGVVEVEDRPTTVKTRVLARRHQVVRYDREDDADVSDAVASRMAGILSGAIGDCEVVVLQDYDKGVLTAALIRGALEGARAADVPVVCDPKRRHFFEYAGATVFKPNARELYEALGERPRPADPEWMEATRGRLDCASLLVTLGEDGLSLQSAGAPLVRVPTAAREVYDVSGAGDTVAAAVAVALGAGGSTVEAALLANHAAAIQVGKAGVATVGPGELSEHVRHFHEELAG